jgi:hypothetical protein
MHVSELYERYMPIDKLPDIIIYKCLSFSYEMPLALKFLDAVYGQFTIDLTNGETEATRRFDV